MKAPWKYLVQLASRGRTVKAPESRPEIETEELADDVADPIAEASNEEASSLDAPNIDTEVAAVNEGDGTLTIAVDRLTADAQEMLPEPAGPPRPPPTERRKRIRKTSVGDVVVSNVVEYGEGTSGVPQPPMTFVDEMTALDEDVRQLRRRLAEKLQLQNAQLKRMLRRYDTP
ncbi:hypothetical protein PWG15_35245 (plasmid) [Ensifer adhaerens]|uniref:hypothetical protein n=1 Tax=Ensifer adhaerens TaxID=106592 RepID=UPI0023A9E96E|nr:hypothetical protein [Ensifer adhaerens]WDZ81596.1 hypothetical protein PWG15_35245 [Ensifer adhaerens]